MKKIRKIATYPGPNMLADRVAELREAADKLATALRLTQEPLPNTFDDSVVKQASLERQKVVADAISHYDRICR